MSRKDKTSDEPAERSDPPAAENTPESNPHNEPGAGAPAKAAMTTSDQINALNSAASNYNRALQQAWERASLDAYKATNELTASQQRILLNAGTRHSAVYQDWYDAVRAEADQADVTQRAADANLKYREAVAEVNKEGQGNLEQSCEAYQKATAAVNEAYANASKEALLAYLAEIKGIWSGSDPQQLDGAALAKLAEATGYAACVARAVLQR